MNCRRERRIRNFFDRTESDFIEIKNIAISKYPLLSDTEALEAYYLHELEVVREQAAIDTVNFYKENEELMEGILKNQCFFPEE